MQIAKIRQQYITLYKNGRNPVWLATGGAWTGLDISDNSADPEDDNAVALLALDKLPFVNISDGKKDFHKAKMDCMFKLKQGIGRLVRRPGRNNMKIVLYDGRIHNKTSGTYWPMRKYYVEGYKAKKL